jgi:ATP-dependent RNA helicase DDX18/HAS1
MQLEKLLQKNYYLHQSAKDGFRSYLQSYASYSHKKIYDVHALDLAKVAKAFGFAVPPKVNIKMGGGESERVKGKKRKHGDDSDEEEVDDDPADVVNVVEGERSVRVSGKHRRMESMGAKKVSKEMYRQPKDRVKGDTQWSR